MGNATTKKVLFVGVLIICYMLWQAAVAVIEYYPITNYPPHFRGPVVLFGDDIITPGEEGLASVLGKRLDIEIEDRSATSTHVSGAQSMVNHDLATLHPNVVIFCFRDNGHDIYFQDLRKLVGAAQQEGAVVVLLGATTEKDRVPYEHRMLRLARETGALAVANILSQTAGDPSYWSGPVPNAKGNLRIADLVAPTLEGLSVGSSQDPTVQ